VIRLTNPVTGHEVRTDEASVDFWAAAGYVKQEEPKAPAKKAASKRAPRKSNG
jgi:hypothetical protein